MWSRSRDGFETHERLISVSSRSQLFKSRAKDVIVDLIMQATLSQISSRYLWQNPRPLVFVTTTTTTATTTTTTTTTQVCGLGLDVSVSRRSRVAKFERRLVSVSGFNVTCPPPNHSSLQISRMLPASSGR